ncbi:MAG: hypothetical protein E7046_11705 [Lentisphaerae bacterium]|nr:hypothetical protein [Lentisphaerota bacterium]
MINRLVQLYMFLSAVLWVLIGTIVFAADVLTAFGAETAEPAAVTNVTIISETVTLPGWEKRVVYTDESDEPKNDKGVLVSAADAKAQEMILEYAGEISESAENGLNEALPGLLAVTGQVPKTATHIVLSVGRGQPSKNLAGEVIEEWSDGTNDWQVVEYNQTLRLPPGRKVRYTFPDQTNDVKFAWFEPWNPEATIHTGKVVRPAALRGVRGLTWRHEKFGGRSGFDFGSAIVGITTVDGIKYALTTNVTVHVNGVDHQLSFRQGAYQEVKAQGEEP